MAKREPPDDADTRPIPRPDQYLQGPDLRSMRLKVCEWARPADAGRGDPGYPARVADAAELLDQLGLHGTPPPPDPRTRDAWGRARSLEAKRNTSRTAAARKRRVTDDKEV